MINGVRLRLYKNCEISPNYKNVLSRAPINISLGTTSPFDEYLSLLSHYDIDIDEAYQEDKTEFNFYLTANDYGGNNNIYEFNYMRIQSIKNEEVVLERYAFISSLKIKNDIAILNYKIDVWHSFINSLYDINYGYLRGYRIIKNRPYYTLPSFDIFNLPLDYAGNNKLEITSKDFSPSVLKQLALILEIQEYDTAQLGNAHFVYTRYCYIDEYHFRKETEQSGGGTLIEEGDTPINMGNIDTVIQQINLLSLKNTLINGAANDYFSIGKIYVVRASSALKNLFYVTNREYIYLEPTQTSSTVTISHKYYLHSANQNYSPQVIETGTYLPNFKMRSIGFYSSQFDISQNGTNLDYSITAFANTSSFKIYFNYQNKYLDVTDIFEFYPIVKNSITGSELTQQRIRKIMQDSLFDASLLNWSVNTAVGLYSGGMNLGKAQTQMAANSSLTNQSLDLGNGFRTTNYANMYEQSAYNYNISQAGLVQDSNNMLTGAFTLAVKRATFDYPQYNYSTIVNSNNIAILNATQWVCSVSINSDNDNIVKDLINYVGFEVFKFVNTKSVLGLNVEGQYFTNNNIYYNIIQFKTIDLVGEFPVNIKLELEKILLSGVRIYYTGSHFMENDTYLENNNLV